MGKLLCLLAVFGVLSGCATSQQSLTIAPEQSVVFANGDLALALEVKRRACPKTQSVRQTCLTLTNSSDHQHRVRYRFHWYDNQGLHVEAPPSQWQVLTLPAKASERIDITVPAARASQYRMVILD
ncbi:YcfL family protein [Salinivibrio sp. ES.052]|uniref:DUF1425 domain-containing protein n=1 Tax=Salinivibrio sp. ES.052 TaxID=1882823 RepID=UPI00092855CF|nr:YcfL family protein [Salinivibrio sp. ES.052]SIN83217.1 Uncharacterized conserved protein YcfL [Salinivibrio sp. ES.052]